MVILSTTTMNTLSFNEKVRHMSHDEAIQTTSSQHRPMARQSSFLGENLASKGWRLQWTPHSLGSHLSTNRRSLMMLIKTVVQTSAIPGAGLGCFSVDFVPKDTLIWKYSPDFDRAYTQSEFDSLEPPAQEFLRFYGYRFKGIYYLSVDNTHYINHSDQPAMYSDASGFLAYAAKDLQPGEEIVDDYRNLGETEEDQDFNLSWFRTFTSGVVDSSEPA